MPTPPTDTVAEALWHLALHMPTPTHDCCKGPTETVRRFIVERLRDYDCDDPTVIERVTTAFVKTAGWHCSANFYDWWGRTIICVVLCKQQLPEPYGVPDQLSAILAAFSQGQRIREIASRFGLSEEQVSALRSLTRREFHHRDGEP